MHHTDCTRGGLGTGVRTSKKYDSLQRTALIDMAQENKSVLHQRNFMHCLGHIHVVTSRKNPDFQLSIFSFQFFTFPTM